MTYSEIAELLANIATMTAAPERMDEAVDTDWFLVAMRVGSMASQALDQIEDDIDAQYAAMIADYEARQDAQADAISAGWGHD